METLDVLIIGAGISGLLSGRELQAAGRTVCILEKSRGLGGRMATRRMAGGRLDHGAQFFTAREPEFQNLVQEGLEAGVIREWFRHGSEDAASAGHPRYCGIHGMTDLPKYLSQALQVRNSAQVVNLARDNGRWVVCTSAGNVYSSYHLLVTAPLPQALVLLDTSGLNYAGLDKSALRSVRYNKGLATLAILDGPSGLPNSGAVQIDAAPLTWIGDNTQKGISPSVSAVTLHADAAFSATHWDSANELRGPLMLAAAEAYLDAKVLEYDCHRWGFTQPVNPWPELYYHNAGLQLTLAGDSFGGARVEGAARSGMAAAKVILQC